MSDRHPAHYRRGEPELAVRRHERREGHRSGTEPEPPAVDLQRLTPSGVLALQRAIGNRAVLHLLQGKLTAPPGTRHQPGIQSTPQAPEKPSLPTISRQEDVAVIQRDLAIQPPGATAPARELTEEEVQEAVDYNTARPSLRSIRAVQDIVGAPVTGTMNADTVRAFARWQADFRLQVDGKVGVRTLRTIVREIIAERDRNGAIQLIVDGHDMPVAGLVSISYDSTLADANATTSGPIPGNSTVKIGPLAFAQGYEGLVHTIRHELEHVAQRRAGMQRQPVREFLAEGIEIMSRGMLAENLAGFMDDAGRCMHFWNLMTADEHRTHWARFTQVRDKVRRRFDAATAAQQATHQATMDAYTAVAEPPAAAGP